MKLYRLLLYSILLIFTGSCHKDVEPTTPEVWSVSTFAGSMQGFEDGDVSKAKFSYPINLVLTAQGDLLVTERGNHSIRKISNGIVSTVAGTGIAGNTDGPVATANLGEPCGIAITADGTIYYSDRDLRKIKKVLNGQVVFVAGGITLTDGTGSGAGFSTPSGLVLGKDNNIYITDSHENSIRKMTLAGEVTTYAGALPSSPPSAITLKDGDALEARFNQPNNICQGSDGTFYITDEQNGKIRKISSEHVTTVAWTFAFPSAVAVASDGTLFALQAGNSTLFKITADGKVTVLFGGKSGAPPFLSAPTGMILAPDGSLLICDTNNHRIARAKRI